MLEDGNLLELSCSSDAENLAVEELLSDAPDEHHVRPFDFQSTLHLICFVGLC